MAWSSASPRTCLGPSPFPHLKIKGLKHDLEGPPIEELSSFIVVVTSLLGRQPDAGKEAVSQVPGSPLSVLTVCRPLFFHPPPGGSSFIQSAIQAVFTHSPPCCLLSSQLTGHQEAQMAELA